MTKIKGLQRLLPQRVYEKLRQVFLFAPDDPGNLLQMPPQREVNVPVERIVGYRYPSPGSQPAASIPVRASDDDVYDIKFFSRDSTNLPSEIKQDVTIFNTSSGPTKLAPDEFKGGSPGQKTPAVFLYDPSGLRSSTTATWASMEKAVIQNAFPDHLVKPAWAQNGGSLSEECEKKGIPVLLGKRFKSEMAGYNKISW